MKKAAILLLLLLYTITPINGQEPATQIRAVWLTTNWQLDWPSGRLSQEQQKEELRIILDKLQKLNFNTVLFQVRVRGSVLYRSAIEPMSSFVKTNATSGGKFDPLAFAVDECHKRNMECHAWMVTYPIGSQKNKPGLAIRHPEMCKLYKGEWYLDPGNPDTNGYILSLVKEIVEGYDVDGIHFDYIRYPDENAGFPDRQAFRKFGNGLSLGEWRRENITKFVSMAYNYVKSIKPWVQVSSSPIGIYRSLSGRGDRWSGYESVYQDSYNWLKLGIHDAVYPMMYYEDNNFYPYIKDWVKNANGRFIVPGLGVYKMLPNEQNWNLQMITRQMDFIRQQQTQGEAFFRLGMILDNVKGIQDELVSYYRHPAKLPPMNWLSAKAPEAPKDFEIYRTDSTTIQLRWGASSSDKLTYTIYSFDPSDTIGTDRPENIIATGIRGSEWKYKQGDSAHGKFFGVSASDRFHNESEIGEIAFFIPSLELAK
jgi:uncharacterized lipoprotein YddW (UPF0748 family)